LDILGGLNLFIEIYLRIWRGFKSTRLLAPFLIIALAKIIILTALVLFYLPPVHKFLIPILSYFFSANSLHFPRYYLILPQIYNLGSNYIVELVFGVVLTAAAVFMIGADYNKEKGGLSEGVRTAFKSIVPLLFIWLFRTALVYIVFSIGGNLIFRTLYGMAYADFTGFFILRVIGLFITSIFVYAVPAIMFHRYGLIKALGVSVKLFAESPFLTFFMLFIPWVIHMPLRYLIFTKGYVILSIFSYAVLDYLLIIDIVLGVFTSFMLYAAITYYYLYKTER
jgi:hypothetical protein